MQIVACKMAAEQWQTLLHACILFCNAKDRKQPQIHAKWEKGSQLETTGKIYNQADLMELKDVVNRVCERLLPGRVCFDPRRVANSCWHMRSM